MYDAKKHLNPNTHLFASGVDGKHYAKACHPDTTTPDWMENIPGPRATYIGVIDERLDYDLIAHMAAAHPERAVSDVRPGRESGPGTVCRRLPTCTIPASSSTPTCRAFSKAATSA